MEDGFPLRYQIACLILSALFIWSFSVSRDPRGWRRLYQSLFAKPDDISVNKNKGIDERLRKWSLIIAMLLLVVDVACFIAGITAPSRHGRQEMTRDQWNQVEELRKLQDLGSAPAGVE